MLYALLKHVLSCYRFDQYADLNIWDRALSMDELAAWTTCQSFEKGNLVSWDTAEFELVNMTSREEPIDAICLPVRPGDVLIPTKRPFESLISICRKFGGKITVVTSQELQRHLSEAYVQITSCERGRGEQDVSKKNQDVPTYQHYKCPQELLDTGMVGGISP